MQQRITEKQISRSNFRLTLGRIFYTYKRHLLWIFGGINFARKDSSQLEFECKSHKTPLLRKLKDVDMYLQHNKVTNLKIAVPKVNSVTLHPGETFSYWKLIGKPTRRKGYLKGMVLKSGKVCAGMGGGLCQLSNMIFWLTLHTPLTVTERHRHSYDVFPDSNRTQPFGSGATCFYNYGDLMITNNTDRMFQLKIKVTEDYLQGAWYSDVAQEYNYAVYERDHIMQQEFWGGYTRHNTIFRRKYDLAGNELDDEYIAENHAIMMYTPFLPESTEKSPVT